MKYFLKHSWNSFYEMIPKYFWEQFQTSQFWCFLNHLILCSFSMEAFARMPHSNDRLWDDIELVYPSEYTLPRTHRTKLCACRHLVINAFFREKDFLAKWQTGFATQKLRQTGGRARSWVNIALFDTQIDSIQCLNFAQNWFNSIFDSK